jgi:hypothetical protein
MSRKRRQEDPNRINVRAEIRRVMSDRADMAREAWSKDRMESGDVDTMVYSAFGRLIEWLDSGERVAIPGWLLTEYAPVLPAHIYWIMPDGSIQIPTEAT